MRQRNVALPLIWPREAAKRDRVVAYRAIEHAVGELLEPVGE